MPRTQSFLIPTLLLLTAVAFVACGSGDGGGGGGGGGGPTGGTISGQAVKGVFTAGTVEARDITAGGAPGSLLGSAAIQANGSYSVSIGNHTGAVHLTVTGGTYNDEVVGSGTAQTAPLTAVVPTAVGDPTANITPLTSMAAEIALRRIALGGTQSTLIVQANTQIANYFGVSNILTTVPEDLSAGAVTGGTAAADYGALLAAISQEANGLSVGADVLAAALAADLDDEVFDGQDSGGAIALGAGNLSATAAQGDLATALTSFLASGANLSGLTSTDFTTLINRLQTNVDNTFFVMSIAVTPGNLTVAMNMQVTYSAQGSMSDGTSQDITGTATWGSSNGSVVSVSGAGVATAGTTAASADVTADQDNASGQSTLTVGNFTLTSITVTPASPQLAINATQQFVATANYSGAGGSADISSLVTWNSATPSVLSLSATGFGSALTVGTSVVSATEPGTTVSGNTTATVFISYAANIQPIFNSNCTSCHPNDANLNLTSYANLMAGGVSGAVVIPNNSTSSIIVQRLEGTLTPQMPQGRPPLPAATIQLIKDWIDAGALNN